MEFGLDKCAKGGSLTEASNVQLDPEYVHQRIGTRRRIMQVPRYN